MYKQMDVQRIIDTRIPDVAPVYGGVRGRTLSSRHHSYAWPAIIEAGVKWVIDLREKDRSSRLPDLCAISGIGYFHYPVDNDAAVIDSMIELLPQFCETIDRGDFYIACAMGLHRTDIALCTYWIFYAADKGIAPPLIRGYRQEDGHNTNKIMRVLNAMYARMTEINGVAPMSAEVFKERKNTINQQSRRRYEND